MTAGIPLAGVKALARWAVAKVRKSGAGMIRRCRSLRLFTDPYDWGAIVLFALLVILVLTTFGDYAISNDEEVQQRYGELIVAYYTSSFADQGLFHFRNLYLYGGLFDVIAVGLEKIIPLDIYAVRHVLSALTGVGGIVAAWATARAIAGSRAGLLAAAALALCGIWYGAMFNHTKDIPFASAMMGATYFLLLIGRELPRPRWRLVLAFGVLCGCALGIRVLGVFLVGYAGLVVIAYALIGRRGSWRDAFAFMGRSALALAPSFVIAYAIMVAAWPWAGLAPLNPLHAIFDFDDFDYPIRTLLWGNIYTMGDVPRWYEPTYVGIKLTLPLLVGACFTLIILAKGLRQTGADTDKLWRKEVALIALAALFPLIGDVAVRGPAFSGMRHVLFTVPPIAVLAGLGLDSTLHRLQTVGRLATAAGLALLLGGFGWDASSLYRLHPDEYLFFNPLVGGLAGASRRYDTDYWVNIMPEAVGDLEHYLDQTDRTPGKQRRHYLVVVCGERLSFEKVADSRLIWTKDQKRADFFIAPTQANCDRAIDGRVVATVERLGVPIGVVKELNPKVKPSLANTVPVVPSNPIR
jgi:Dolichyl-phosphate-mannose-protein mannosyltransferase